MRQLDVLDLSAKEHRRIHRELSDLLHGDVEVARSAVGSFARLVAEHEAADRLLLHPPLMRDDHGQRLVLDRRSEQALIASHLGELARALENDPTDPRPQLAELEQVLVGHTDREEIEDFPHLRRLTSERERLHLARIRRQLKRHITLPSPAPRSIAEGGDRLDPLRAAEAAARHALTELGGATVDG